MTRISYELDAVNSFKKLLAADENYWDEDLSIEFCIARRTRDILLSRKIVDDFIQSKRTAQKNMVLDFELKNVWEQYFLEYVRDEQSVADFWAIFLEPTEKFATQYSEHDKIWFPKVLEAHDSGELSDDLKSGLEKLLVLFKAHRNKKYWSDENEWEYFLSIYLGYLTNHMHEQVCRNGLSIFISTIIKMQKIVESSGWKIDYNLYANPLQAWGGQSLSSKFRAWKRAKLFENKAKKRLFFFSGQNRNEENPYSLLGFWEFAILSTLIVVFFPWSILICVIFLGLAETKLIILALLRDFIRLVIGVLTLFLIIAVIIIFFIAVF